MASDPPYCPSVDVALKANSELVLSQRFIKSIIENWDTSMNLYTHNCQHFSEFVKDLLNASGSFPSQVKSS